MVNKALIAGVLGLGIGIGASQAYNNINNTPKEEQERTIQENRRATDEAYLARTLNMNTRWGTLIEIQYALGNEEVKDSTVNLLKRFYSGGKNDGGHLVLEEFTDGELKELHGYYEELFTDLETRRLDEPTTSSNWFLQRFRNVIYEGERREGKYDRQEPSKLETTTQETTRKEEGMESIITEEELLSPGELMRKRLQEVGISKDQANKMTMWIFDSQEGEIKDPKEYGITIDPSSIKTDIGIEISTDYFEPQVFLYDTPPKERHKKRIETIKKSLKEKK